MTARRWHRPSALAWLLMLIGVVAFAGLGQWQLTRKVEKEHLLAAFANAPSSAPQNLDEVRDSNDESRYPHVHVTGHFVPDRGYLLDEQIQNGQPGVHAIGVFATASNDRLLLVDRGWMAWNHAVGTTPPLPALANGETQLTGIYAPYPGGGIRVGGNPLPAQSTWPKLTLHVDPNEIAGDLGKPVLPRILLLDPDHNSVFVREWTPNVMPPDRHAAYAFQWFALALAAIVIFVARHWRRADNAQR